MQDPRIIECAKAMHEASGIMIPWNVVTGNYRDHLLIHARACILKWLEQPPTPNMEPDGGLPDWREHYTAMNAQAAKELQP